MSYEVEFDDFMDETITLEAVASTDEYGARTYSAATSHTARIVRRHSQVTDFEGRLVAAVATIYVSGTSLPTSVGPSDRITLPDGSTPPIVAVEEYPDEDTNHHIKIMLGTSAMLR